MDKEFRLQGVLPTDPHHGLWPWAPLALGARYRLAVALANAGSAPVLPVFVSNCYTVQGSSASAGRKSAAVGLRESTTRRDLCLVANVRTIGVSLSYQCHVVSIRRTALLPHLRVVEVQQ